MDPLIVSLRLVHILLGTVWVGTIVFNTLFLGPAIQEAGPGGGQVMGALQRRGMMSFLPLLGLLTILSGVWLLWLVSAGFNAAYFHSGVGHAFAGGGALSILGYLVGLLVLRPAMVRAMSLGQGMAQVSDDVER